jgi:murein tripeptide amidase MpaA
VKFNLMNFSKSGSLFNHGMKVLVYSEAENRASGVGWFREGEGIRYFNNGIRRSGLTKTYYTLTFAYRFKHSSDHVYFAYCYPYSYSDLLTDLAAIEHDPIRASLCSRKLLCETLAGNRCEVLTITAPGTVEDVAERRGAVVTARVHPGETVGSWMMSGVLDYLLSDAAEAQILRANFVFKIVPMLNPDGVIVGNYRTSLIGADLNRRWKTPSKMLHPTIFSTKRLIKDFARERTLELVCDLHGHSRRKNVFMYGCHV